MSALGKERTTIEKTELLARQQQLQVEAAAVAEEMNLIPLLKAAGMPVTVGSAGIIA